MSELRFEYMGQQWTLKELAARARISVAAMRNRIRRGWPIERAAQRKPGLRIKSRRHNAQDLRAQRLMAAGLCVSCGLEKEEDRAKVHRCKMCSDRGRELAAERDRLRVSATSRAVARTD